jgi:hypothetical protein
MFEQCETAGWVYGDMPVRTSTANSNLLPWLIIVFATVQQKRNAEVLTSMVMINKSEQADQRSKLEGLFESCGCAAWIAGHQQWIFHPTGLWREFAYHLKIKQSIFLHIFYVHIYITCYYVQQILPVLLLCRYAVYDVSRIAFPEPTDTRSILGFNSTFPNRDSGHNIYITLDLINPIGTWEGVISCRHL